MMPELEECISDQLGDATNASLMQQYCSEVKWQYVQPLTTNHGSGTLLVHRLQQQCATLTKLLQTSVVVVRSFYCSAEKTLKSVVSYADIYLPNCIATMISSTGTVTVWLNACNAE